MGRTGKGAQTLGIGPQSETDSRFVAKCRLQQSKYRATILRENYGVGPYAKSKSKYGNFLIDGERSGKNFVTECAFLYAKQRVRDRVVCRELTIDDYRLFNNMMSSMPLCFNLFSDLREILLEDERACSAVIRALFKEISWIDLVLYIGVEFVPVPTDLYVDDKSAFDAIIIVQDNRGELGLICIETKYTDILGANTSSKNDKKNRIVEGGRLFSEELMRRVKATGYKQLYRNFLLTYTYAKHNKLGHWTNVIISPKEDLLSKKEMDELIAGLRRYKDRLHKIDLEEFIERGVAVKSERIARVYEKIRERYV